MLYLTEEVIVMQMDERIAHMRQARELAEQRHANRTTGKARFGDAAMIWIASGLAAAFALALWL